MNLITSITTGFALTALAAAAAPSQEHVAQTAATANAYVNVYGVATCGEPTGIHAASKRVTVLACKAGE